MATSRKEDVGIYRTVEVRMWGDEDFCSLSRPQPNAQTIWQFLLTGPYTTSIPGVVLCKPASIAVYFDWLSTPEQFAEQRASFDELIAKQMAVADERAGLIFLPKALRPGRKSTRPRNPNQIRAWGKVFDRVPECQLKEQVREAIRKVAAWCDEHSAKKDGKFIEAFLESFGEPFDEPTKETSEPFGEPFPEPIPDPQVAGSRDQVAGSREQCVPNARTYAGARDSGGPFPGPSERGREATRLAELQAQLRNELIDELELDARRFSDGDLQHPKVIIEALSRGHTPEQLEDALRACAAEARGLGHVKFLDGFRNWLDEQILRARVQTPAEAEADARRRTAARSGGGGDGRVKAGDMFAFANHLRSKGL